MADTVRAAIFRILRRLDNMQYMTVKSLVEKSGLSREAVNAKVLALVASGELEESEKGSIKLSDKIYQQTTPSSGKGVVLAAASSALLRITFRQMLLLLGFLFVLGAILGYCGYGPNTPLGAVMTSLFAATLICVVLSGTTDFDIGWLKATGGTAVFFGVFLLLRPEVGKDTLPKILHEHNSTISTLVRSDAKSYQKLLQAMDEVNQARKEIGEQRPEIAEFVSLSEDTSVWKERVLTDLKDRYRRLNDARAPMGDLARVLDTLRPRLTQDPRFILLFAVTQKRVIEESGGAGGEAAFKDVMTLVDGIKDFDLPEVGEVYRVAANTARRAAEGEKKASAQNELLEKAESLLSTSLHYSKRRIDTVLYYQSMANVSEAKGDYAKALAMQTRCVKEFESPLPTPEESALKLFPGDYLVAVCERIRLMAETDAKENDMLDAIAALKDAPEFNRMLADIYISMAHPDLFDKYETKLLEADLDKLSSAYFNLLRARKASQSGDFSEALPFLHSAKLYIDKYEPSREGAEVDKWIKDIDDKKPIADNFFAHTRFSPT